MELDGAMVEVARHWFGFESHGSLVAYTADGIGFVEAAAKKGGHYTSTHKERGQYDLYSPICGIFQFRQICLSII